MDQLIDDEYEQLLDQVSTVLAAVYRRVAWHRMHNSNPHDVFQHKIRAAATRANFSQFLGKLCDGLGIQSLKGDPALLETIKCLNRQSGTVLSFIRKEHILLVAESTARARAYKERLKQQHKAKTNAD